ncbi:hypothetical protein [Bradyrhizobium lablabi]|nr:hypothetical protein [Bradyrhizobium lablabi]MBR0694587.1 hypothetical protein [Bradyrhizobium lablabi]
MIALLPLATDETEIIEIIASEWVPLVREYLTKPFSKAWLIERLEGLT